MRGMEGQERKRERGKEEKWRKGWVWESNIEGRDREYGKG